MSLKTKADYLNSLKEKGVTVVTGVKKYEAVTEDGLVVIDSGGK